MADFIYCPGKRGSYQFWFVDGPVVREPGVYMFVKSTHAGWVPVYIGITDGLNARLSNHDMWQVAQQCGATRVMAHTCHDLHARQDEEADLISYWNPECNSQLRTLRPRTIFGSS
jgi:hypothetical protein